VPYCPKCGMQIAEGAACPQCAAGSVPPTPQTVAASGLTENVAGMLAYFTFIPAIVFLVLEPYNKSRFIRFHAFQCIFVTVAFVALGIALGIISMIPFLGLITIPLHFVIWLGAVALWIVLVLKAYQGQMFKLPVVGDMAEKQAGA